MLDTNREGRLVLQDGLIECCDKYSNIGVNSHDRMMQVGMLDASREGRCK